MKDALPFLAIALPLLVAGAVAYYTSRQNKKQDVAKWSRDKYFDFYNRANAHYGNPERLQVISDQPDITSGRLISEAELLSIPQLIIDRMKEEQFLRTHPEKMNRSSSPHQTLWFASQAVVNAMQEDMRINIHGVRLKERLFSSLDRWQWRIYDFRVKKLSDPLYWDLRILPVLIALLLIADAVLVMLAIKNRL